MSGGGRAGLAEGTAGAKAGGGGSLVRGGNLEQLSAWMEWELVEGEMRPLEAL